LENKLQLISKFLVAEYAHSYKNFEFSKLIQITQLAKSEATSALNT